MLKQLKAFLDRLAERPADRSAEEGERVLKQATAALLIEVSRADAHVGPDEEAAIRAALEKRFGLDAGELRELYGEAEDAADAAVSLSEFTQRLNERLSAAERVHVIELLWQVAYADGHVDKYEDYYIRRIAELLYVSHTDFIRMKHRVADALAGAPAPGGA